MAICPRDSRINEQLGMVIRLHARPSRIALSSTMIIGFLLASWAALRPWIAQRMAGGQPTHVAAHRALVIDPDNDRVLATLATLYHYSLLLRDYPAALTAYRSILRNNPLDSTSWLHLGKLYEQLGRLPDADQAFRLAVHLEPSNAALLWEIVVGYLDQEQVPQALDTLTRYLSVAHHASDLAKGYELANRLLPPEEVLNTLIPVRVKDYTAYANYLLDRNLGDQALAVWNRLPEVAGRTGDQVAPSLQLRVIDLLIATGKLDQAHRLWVNLMTLTQPDAAPTESNLVSNGNFERNETVGRGFDWRIGNAPGVAAALDPFMSYAGRQSLKLSFTKSRADFSHVSQTVPVQPHATYAIRARVKTDGLNGPGGITVEALDPAGVALVRTDAIGGTRDWTLVTAQFRTSGVVGIVILRVHHDPPPPYLPPLSGSAWIDNVSLTKVE